MLAGTWELTRRISSCWLAKFIYAFSFYLDENIYIDLAKEIKFISISKHLMIDLAILLFSISSPVLSSAFFPWVVTSSLHWSSQPFEADSRNHTDTDYFYSQTFHKEASITSAVLMVINVQRFFAPPGVSTLTWPRMSEGSDGPWRSGGDTGG